MADAPAPRMHLLVRDGSPVDPVAIGRDAAGARAVAELYVPGPGTTVRAMLNTSLDGAIAGADGTSGTLRNDDDSFVFGVLRALTDVILVGASTVRVEDYTRRRGRADLREPSLRPSGAEIPHLAVMTTTGDLPPDLAEHGPTLLVCPPDAVSRVTRASGFAPDSVLAAVGPREIVAALAARGLRAIQLEGGPTAVGRFAAAGALTELCLSTSFLTVGGDSPRLTDGPAHEADWELRSLLAGERASCARYSRRPDART